jgi:hypothetical protein
MAWGLRQAHIPRDYGLKYVFRKEFAEVGRHLFGQAGSLVEHGQQHAFDFEPRIEALFHAVDCVHERGNAFEREVFALDRNQDRVGRGERVDCEEIERRRTVQDDEVVTGPQLFQLLAEARFAAFAVGKLDVGAGEMTVGRQKIELRDLRLQHDGLRFGLIHEDFVHSRAVGALRETQSGRRVRLGIAIRNQNAAIRGGERGCQIDRGRSLPYAAFLIRNGDDAAQWFSRFPSPNVAHSPHVSRGTRAGRST